LMNATEELRGSIRSRIREHLALLAAMDSQRRYRRDVPTADVPAELFCVWFDDIYHPESPAHQQAFTQPETVALEEFNALFDEVASILRDIRDLSTLQAHPEWIRVSKAAEVVLLEIPSTLPHPPSPRT
jgi:hypothetical protein